MMYKSVDDRKLFYFEKNLWHPDRKGFDATNFLKVTTATVTINNATATRN